MKHIQENPTVFISYSWDDEDHKEWVLQLSNKLVENGIDVELDQYNLYTGTQFTRIIEKVMATARKVIIVSTPDYKIKAENKKGGVGHEYSIISAELYNKQENTKFLPILRRGTLQESIPSFMQHILHVDFTNDALFEKRFDELIHGILDLPPVIKPPLGKLPERHLKKLSQLKGVVETQTGVTSNPKSKPVAAVTVLPTSIEEAIKNPSKIDFPEIREQAGKEYKENKYELAAIKYLWCREFLSPAEQTRLGYLYDKGYGVKQDYAKAMVWYQKAANRGNAAAMTNIGWLYNEGNGVKRDYAEAMERYIIAADKEDARAMGNIGYLYSNGFGVKQDNLEAIKWYLKAGNRGDEIAMYNIGIKYEYGRGVTKDFDKSKEWYQKASDKGHKGAIEALKRLEK